MVLFIGTETDGFFVEEVAAQFHMSVQYTGEILSLETLKYQALQERYQYIILDVSSLSFASENMGEIMRNILQTIQGELIVFARGYMEESSMVKECVAAGVQFFLLSNGIAQLKEELSLAFQGKASPFALQNNRTAKQLNGQTRSHSIGVAGSLPRIGTTTQCIQIIKYLQQAGHTACYIEMNHNRYIAAMKEVYFDYMIDEKTGKFSFEHIDCFEKENIVEVMKMNYDYLVYDFGSTTDSGFQLTSFLEKEKRIILCGSTPPELQAMERILDSFYHNDVEYLFSFVSEVEQSDVIDQMQERQNHVFFTGYTPDAFCYSSTNTAMYETMIPLSSQQEAIELTQKKQKEHKGFFHRRKGK